MPEIDYMAIAALRSQTPDPCESCEGTGVEFDPRTCDATPCTWCNKSGHESGRCECGYFGILVPDAPRDGLGRCDGATLVCPKCAVTCGECCDVVSTHRADDGCQYCEECWQDELLRLSVLESAGRTAAANQVGQVAK